MLAMIFIIILNKYNTYRYPLTPLVGRQDECIHGIHMTTHAVPTDNTLVELARDLVTEVICTTLYCVYILKFILPTTF